MLTSGGGWPVSSDTFYPFGEEQNPTSDPNHYKFTGKERDAESGLDNFGARYYGSSMGRFMSPDWSGQEEPVPYAKLGDPQSLNLYSYVNNNPLVHIDLDGHSAATDADASACAAANASGNYCSQSQQNQGAEQDSKLMAQQLGQDPTLPTAVAPPPPSLVGSLMNTIFPQSWEDMAGLALMVPTDGLAEGTEALSRALELASKLTEEGVGGAEKVAKITEEADKLYPSKVGKIEAHHDMPKALGGPKSGPTTDIPASYHQLITNMTRTLTNNYTDFSADAKAIMDKVYSYFPIHW